MGLIQKVVDGIALDTDRVVWDDDTPGLGLRVQRGRKSWIVRYRVAGIQRQKSLPGGLTLKKARAEAAEIRTAATRGADLVADGRKAAETAQREAEAAAEKARRAAEAAEARSLGTIVDRYLVDAEKRLRPASYKVTKLYLTGEKYWQQLRERPADELTRREILAVLEPWNGKVTAAQMLHHLSACLTWGVKADLIERNCAFGIKPPVQKTDRERVLSDEEIKQLWAATEPTGSDTVEDRYARILRLLLLTGQRRGEVGGMRWAELDLERQLWRLPGERTKNGLPHNIPLSRQALASVLAPDLTAVEHVFGADGFTGWHRSKRQLDDALPLAPWTVHDLRRTVVTGMAEVGIAPHIVEAVVNHVSGHKGGVAGVYNRAKYVQEKRAALERWANHVEMLVSGASTSVVPMRRTAK